jgi:hypothetical protein
MNQRTKNILFALFFTFGLTAVLKFYFKIPDIAILFCVILGAISGLTSVVIRGFINPPSWLYRIRFSVLGFLWGISIGILNFGMESIQKKTFVMRDLSVHLIIGLLIGLVFSIIFSLQKLKRQKGSERQLAKDSALLIKQNGEKIKGELVLTDEQLIFLGNRKKEKIWEKEVRETHPNISKTKLLGVPNGFKLENDEILLKVSFPYYWLKSIKKKNTTA